MEYFKRFLKLIFGLLLFSFGYYLSIQANIGLAPWSAFSQGVSARTGTTYGVITILSSLAIMLIDIALKEQIGWGMILDSLLVGPFVDMFTAMNLVPMLNGFLSGVVLLLVGLEVICIGSYFYISAALSAGPRDTLMVALVQRLPRVPLALIRCCIEGTALLIGWLCGAKVGVGTVLSVVCLGVMLQYTFKVLHFDVKSVKNENVIETARNMMKRSENTP